MGSTEKTTYTVDYRPSDKRFPYAVVPLTGKEIYEEIPWVSFNVEKDARAYADDLNGVKTDLDQADVDKLVWVAEAWDDDTTGLRDLGVFANPGDEPERARSEAEARLRAARSH